MKELADRDVLQLLSRTIVDAAAGGWLRNALLPVVSALLAVGAIIPELSAADSPGSHGVAAMPVREFTTLASPGAANAGATAAAPVPTERPVSWIEDSATAAAGGCAALVAAALRFNRGTQGSLGPKTGVTPHTNAIHGLSTMAASCQTLAGLVLVQSTREAALQAHAASAIFRGLQFVAQVPHCVEIAGMLVSCCGALAIAFSLAPSCDKGGSSIAGTGRSSTGRREARDETRALSQAGDGRPDAWVLESAASLAAAVRMSWTDICQQLSTR